MGAEGQDERGTRAARNQSLFRAINEKLTSLNEAFETVTETFTIACECADTTCVAMVDIRPEAYQRVREHPRHFVVLRGHVYPDVETVISESDGYAVVEKAALAGELAEELADREQRELAEELADREQRGG